jgi:hypothetical protein
LERAALGKKTNEQPPTAKPREIASGAAIAILICDFPSVSSWKWQPASFAF